MNCLDNSFAFDVCAADIKSYWEILPLQIKEN